MTLPAYWWLLALTVVPQAVFFVRIGLGRMGGKGVQPVSRTTALLLFGSCVAGGAYGFVQSDPLFFFGQACLAFIYSRAFFTDQ